MALGSNGLPLLMAENTPQLALFVEVKIDSGSGRIVKLGVSFGVVNAETQGTPSDIWCFTEE
jgi:hypothetical protein